MSSVRYADVTCQYPGAVRPSVTDLNLDIADGEFLVLVGPSGCGKSTTLRMLAGLEEVTGGNIYIGDRDVTHTPARDRDIAMVFQNYALYPHMTVAENMGFALRIAKIPADQRRARVEEAAAILDLTDYLERKPKALSGGQRQRVAMGRAIVRSPQVFLMDEPLSNLDAKLRVATRTQIASLTRRLGVTTVYVTHDQVEAMTMGDRVAVLKDGVLVQVDTPRGLYDRPNSEFVAGFIGSPAMNLFRAPLAGGAAELGSVSVPLTRAQQAAVSGPQVTVGIRPEDLTPAPEGTGLPIAADVVEELGADAFVYGHLAPVTATGGPGTGGPGTGGPGTGGSTAAGSGAAGGAGVVLAPTAGAEDPAMGQGHQQIIVRVEGRTPPVAGTTIWVTPDLDRLHLFDTTTGNRLPD